MNFNVGDKVIFNGETGIIIGVNPMYGTYEVQLDIGGKPYLTSSLYLSPIKSLKIGDNVKIIDSHNSYYSNIGQIESVSTSISVFSGVPTSESYLVRFDNGIANWYVNDQIELHSPNIRVGSSGQPLVWSGVALAYGSDSHKAVMSNLSATECLHNWKEYFGLNHRDIYCTKCNKTK
jgi:hypothetical protein